MEDNNRKFSVIGITRPQPEDNLRHEADKITLLLATGALDSVHIRRPDDTTRRVQALIEAIPQRLHGRIRLHGHSDLLTKFNLMGLHLNSAGLPTEFSCAQSVSRSCHTPDEVQRFSPQYDFVTLSPIFPSISKVGYLPQLDARTIDDVISRFHNVVALGGVTPDVLHSLELRGFAGAAMLGALWEGDIEQVAHTARRIKMLRSSNIGVQFITDSNIPDVAIAQAHTAISGGVKWVQVRMKDAPDNDLVYVVKAIRQMHPDTIIIIDDRVHLVASSGADGVHLGQNDMQPSLARKHLGLTKIIGLTANMLDHIHNAPALDVDYLGVGPLRYTSTKANLAPTIGLDGYNDRVAAADAKGLPLVAIGGVTPDDITPLRQARVAGFAVSGDINHHPSPVARASQYIHTFNNTI